MNDKFYIVRSTFDRTLPERLQDYRPARDFWPVVYILIGNEKAYVGETTDIAGRMKFHLGRVPTKDLNKVYLITGEGFNKSIIKQIETYLMEYMAGDGKYRLLNGTGGSRHNYDGKKEVWELCERIWLRLKD